MDRIFSKHVILVVAILIALLGIIASAGSILFYSTPKL